MNKFLFVTYGGGHVAMLAPIWRILTQKGYEVDFLALTTAQGYLSNQDIPFWGFKDIPGNNDSIVQNYGNALVENLASKIVSREESIAYLGSSYKELVDRHGEKEAEQLYKTHGRQAFLPIETLKKAINWLNPNIVLATNSPRAERAAILAARELGLPSVCLVDLFAIQEIEWIGKPGYANKVCVINEDVRKMFLNYGRQPNEVIVTGNPAFDTLKSPEVRAKGLKLRQENGWNDNVITLLWASQVEPLCHPFKDLTGDPSLPYQIETVLRDFVRNNPNFRLIIRYHPSQNINFIEQERVFLSKKTEDLHEILHAIDGVITMTSTVGLEASLIGKTVISVDNSIFFEDAPYSKMGISFGVPLPSILPSKILELYKEGRFSASFSEDNDKRNINSEYSISSTMKVVQVLESLLILNKSS